ncbi:MAG: ABC transporter ATP-binding protein [Nitrospirae bacterium]|nr:ABC transporter ATP-binding protein [Nitrospirota bacterium]
MIPPPLKSQTSNVNSQMGGGTPPPPEIVLDHLRYSHSRPGRSFSTPLLDEITLSIRPSETVGIVGPNGTGKTTLLRLISGVLRPLAGRIIVGGRDLHHWRPRALAQTIAVMPQEFSVMFPYTVEEIVLTGRAPYRNGLGWETEEDYSIVDKVLERTDLGNLRRKPFPDLSAGEKGRVLLARALAQQAPVLLLDEPTESLDLRYRVRLLDKIMELRETRGMTLVIVSHDVNLIAEYCPRVILLHGGRVVGDGPVDSTLTPATLKEVFEVDVIRGEHPLTHSPHFFLAPRS